MDDVAFVFVPTLLLLVVRIASVAVSGEVEKFKIRVQIHETTVSIKKLHPKTDFVKVSKLTRKRIQLEKDCDVVTERAKTSPYTLLVSRVAQPGIVAGLLLWYWSSPGLCIPRYWAWPLGRGDSYSDCSRIGIVVWLAVSHLLATSVAAFVFSPWLLWRCRHMLP